ncbi:MAG: hypothetical protein ABR585_05580 [Gemmatimonadaceae bacterium]
MLHNHLGPVNLGFFCTGAIWLTGCVVDNASKQTTADTTHVAPVVTVTAVNHGAGGMREQVRWILSPDKRALLVVDDPVAIENDPIPNAFFFGDEGHEFQIQMDSVWDVVPSPDWKSLAFARAFTIQTGPAGEINLLPEVSRRTGIDTATLRSGSFPTSGMVGMSGVAQPGVIRIPENPRQAGAADSAAPKMFPVARGWHVRWTTDGTALALGSNPAHGGDNEPSQTWSALDPSTGALHGSLPANTSLYEPSFTNGPTFELSAPVPLDKSPPISVNRGGKTYSIESERGVITISETTAGAPKSQRVVGAGMALTATAGGRYIVAIAPRAKPEPHGMAVEPVVYTVTW